MNKHFLGVTIDRSLMLELRQIARVQSVDAQRDVTVSELVRAALRDAYHRSPGIDQSSAK